MKQEITDSIKKHIEKASATLKPMALKPGDCVAVIAMSSPGNPQELNQIEQKLSDLGLVFEFLPSCTASHGHLAGVDALRVADFHRAFSEDKYAGIMCMKGGAGSYRLLDQLNYELVKQHPKVFIGYSDATALHMALQAKTGLVTFHGPMAYSKWPEWTSAAFKQMVMCSTKGVKIENPPGEAIQVLVPGSAEGRLVGGNLSLLVSTLGSPYEIDTKDAILFIEDTLEPTYVIDRMLNALRLAGKFRDAAGILLGTWTKCAPEEKNSYPGRDLELETIFNELVVPAGRPTLSNVWFGHNVPQITLPIGTPLRLTGMSQNGSNLVDESPTLVLLEDSTLQEKRASVQHVHETLKPFYHTEAWIESLGDAANNLSLSVTTIDGKITKFEWRPDVCQHAASLIKVPILLHLLMSVAEGTISLREQRVLKSEDQVGGCGSLQLMTPSRSYDLQELMRLMICLSDNTATNMLIELLDKNAINRRLKDMGFHCTQVARKLMVGDFSIFSTTNATEMVRCLALLADCDVLPEHLSTLALETLALQQYNDRLSAQWGELPFMHKTGEITGVIHDAGIVEVDGVRYIIAALLKDQPTNYEGVQRIQTLGANILKDLVLASQKEC